MSKLTKTKQWIENVKETIPLISKLTVDNIKDNFEKNGQEILGNANGTIGIVIKLFGQKLIDKYFENLSENKLQNFGLGIYFKAACEQGTKSLLELDEIYIDHDSQKRLIKRFEEVFEEKKANIADSEITLDFNAQRHPACTLIKSICIKLLEEYTPDHTNYEDLKNKFIRSYNENIEEEVKKHFGDDYQKHQEEINEKWIKNQEGKLLNHMVELNKIGFLKGEDFTYQKTYGSWKIVDKYRYEETGNYKKDIEKINEIEESLVPLEEMISEYFGTDDTIEKIMFIIADFGKGKSVFLKRYASTLAKKHMQTCETPIPVYFNLREFDEFDQGSTYGVISDYLAKKFGLNVEDEDFKQKEYVFLIDSLDECGNLSEDRIDKVLRSVKKIQNIDEKKCRKNRIIISSRPIEHGLEKHLNMYHPYMKKNQENRPINYFASVYGFKIDQFNNWIREALKAKTPINIEIFQGISRDIITNVMKEDDFNIYKLLFDKQVITYDELKRPIFAYMIYKLIMSNTDLSTANKIGVYLSFVNVLTKEAKYINSVHKINLMDEYRFRNILHSTAALWMFETHKGGNGFLKKHDISNTIEGAILDIKDEYKMEKYKEVEDIEFISQSYFGQEGDTFYFQHQSFAEMLLAEYYLKIFIRYALDESISEEIARKKLILGNPSEQTIDFLGGLLKLLKECAVKEADDDVKKKRKLLFPMIASMAIPEYSKELYTPYINLVWLKSVKFEPNSTEPPSQLLENWIINEEEVEKIINLCRKILDSNATYLLTNAVTKYSSLFKDEVLQLSEPVESIVPEIDKWLALLVGNTLCNEQKIKKYFNKDLKKPEVLFDMLKRWNAYNGQGTPSWGRQLFQGIKMRKVEIDTDIDTEGSIFLSLLKLRFLEMEKIGLNGIDFSDSELYKISFTDCDMSDTNFTNTILNVTMFMNCSLYDSNFTSARIERVAFFDCVIRRANFNARTLKNVVLELCQIEYAIFLPKELSNEMEGRSGTPFPHIGYKSYIYHDIDSSSKSIINNIMYTISPFLSYVKKERGISNNVILSWFIFENAEDKQVFKKWLKSV
ncbi:pentapeptide repeat-containing protein [Brevibacillus sp. MER 51]|uniref:NACHT domain-containing protein n=1 Tax=Brevibacillus sp. MER 51 TaxID=2939560 RepID=UPI002041DD18|nr:pentapeptide repeat-containing protein [Brevibacillus sp. MER 51]MCM3143088.1 pentapeptide repeat-containing protein [Brevibacillus sp. MER 51]